MNMAVVKWLPGVRLRRLAGKVAATRSMTELSDERASQAITVLLVEDDAPTCWRLHDALAKAGLKVTAAANLAEARACLAQGGPQVLLTDLQLPDGHGIELIRETRQRFPNLATIIPRTSKRAFALRALASLSPARRQCDIFTRRGSGWTGLWGRSHLTTNLEVAFVLDLTDHFHAGREHPTI